MSTLLSTLLVGLLIASCAGGPQLAGEPCLDDSPACIEARTTLVSGMVGDPGRTWIGTPASARTHASGVRLFAYRSTRDKLSCAELAAALGDLAAAKASLAKGRPTGVTAERHHQVMALTDEVRADLDKTRRRKCKV